MNKTDIDRELDDFGRFSDPALMILLSLADGPKHGYAMTEDIAAIADLRLGPGTLYGARWRRRYGDERRSLVTAQRFSIGNTIDLIAGAIDAWIHPQMIAAARPEPAPEGEQTMLARMMKLRCAGYGPNITRADQWKSAAVMIGTTLVLTLGWMWLRVWTDDNPYVDAFSAMPFFAGLMLSMRYTYLKTRSGAAQAIFIGGTLAIIVLIFGLAGWVNASF